jgi:hypothetical protein
MRRRAIDYAVKRHRLYAEEASTLCGGGIDSMRRRDRLYAVERDRPFAVDRHEL